MFWNDSRGEQLASVTMTTWIAGGTVVKTEPI
jgi:hypothetical protein